jgi:hypothetical protein
MPMLPTSMQMPMRWPMQGCYQLVVFGFASPLGTGTYYPLLLYLLSPQSKGTNEVILE